MTKTLIIDGIYIDYHSFRKSINMIIGWEDGKMISRGVGSWDLVFEVDVKYREHFPCTAQSLKIIGLEEVFTTLFLCQIVWFDGADTLTVTYRAQERRNVSGPNNKN